MVYFPLPSKNIQETFHKECKKCPEVEVKVSELEVHIEKMKNHLSSVP